MVAQFRFRATKKSPWPVPYGPELQAIEAVVARHAEGASVTQIADALAEPGARRMLQYRLRVLVDAGRPRLMGDKRAARYHVGNEEGR